MVELLIRHGARVQFEDKVMRGKGCEGCACMGEELCLVDGMVGIRANVSGYYERLQEL
jgi:hypothetical protein